ncbi:MAG: alpha-amylase family glycosyl hydrolase [Candidatus Bathyarchaeia archaeon]|jgi:alpha-glucosidase
MLSKILVLLIGLSLVSSSTLPIIQETSTANSFRRLVSSVNVAQRQPQFNSLASDIAFETPDWVKNAVFYQIFPDRFRNGDPTNDPAGNGVSGDLLWKAWNGSSQYFPAVYALKMPWTQLPEEPAMGRDWFGGDLKGVQDEAQYLAHLGITAIYLNPIMDSTDNHGYTVIDYKSVSRYFGANARASNGSLILDPEASLQVFENMTDALKTHGIRVILDGVFNHVSAKNQWFDRDNDYSTLGAFESQSSPWSDWFTFYNWPKSYRAWGGFLNMPEVNEVDAFKNYIYADPNASVIKFWNDLGVDGWRLDTGQDVSHGFWKEFRSAYKKLNPEGYIVGEYWGDASPWLQGDEWDSVTNYGFRDAVLAWAAGENVESETALDYALTSIQKDYPSEAFYTAFNLLDSHDTERALTYLAGDKNRMKLAVIFQMTYPGTPVIYYGDEVGMQGLSDPDCRRPYPWSDLGLSPDTDMLAHYKKLISIRETYSVLRTGSLSTLLVDNANHIYALLREDNSSNPMAVLVYNNGVNQTSVTLNVTGLLPEGATLTDALNDKVYKVENGRITLLMEGLWASILIGTSTSISEFPWNCSSVITLGVAFFVVATTVVRTVRQRRKSDKQRPT